MCFWLWCLLSFFILFSLCFLSISFFLFLSNVSFSIRSLFFPGCHLPSPLHIFFYTFFFFFITPVVMLMFPSQQVLQGHEHILYGLCYVLPCLLALSDLFSLWGVCSQFGRVVICNFVKTVMLLAGHFKPALRVQISGFLFFIFACNVHFDHSYKINLSFSKTFWIKTNIFYFFHPILIQQTSNTHMNFCKYLICTWISQNDLPCEQNCDIGATSRKQILLGEM